MKFFGNGELDQHFQAYNSIKLSLAEEEALYQVAVLYYEIAINEERLQFLNMNLDRLKKLRPIVSLQVEQGFAKTTDLEKLIVKTSNLESAKNKLESGIAQQVRYLKLMMGVDQGEDIRINFEENNLKDAGIAEMNEDGQYSKRLLEEQRALNSMNAKKINADYYPRLQAYAAFLFQAQRERINFLQSNQDWYNIHQWGLKLSVPIMRGFKKKHSKEVSALVHEQLSLGIEQSKVQSELEYQNAVTEFEVARDAMGSQQENVLLAEKMYQQSELNYEQGTALLMDFLDSEATLREAKMVYATSLLDTRLAELKILKASGRLKELIDP
jgi:outer membrane protein TolC